MEIRPFKAVDLMSLRVQERHQEVLDVLVEDDASLLEGPYSWTATELVPVPTTVIELPVACCGIFKPPHLPPMAWAFLGDPLKQKMVQITREVRKVLDLYPGAVCMEVDPDFPEGVRWAGLLGFRPYGKWLWVRDAHLS